MAQIGALHEILIALTVEFEEMPRVPSEQRIKVVHVFEGLWYVTAYFGFIEIPDLPTIIREAHNLGCPVEQDKAVYFGLRDKIVPISRGNPVLRWQLSLFAFMFRNSVGASVLFRIPSHQYLEVGRQLEV